MDLLFLATGGLTHMDRPRDVGAIPTHTAAEIEHDRVAFSDTAVAGFVMRRRAIRSRSDDRESHLIVAFRSQEVRQVRSDFALRPTGERPLENSCVRAVGGLGYQAKGFDLGVVLAHS